MHQRPSTSTNAVTRKEPIMLNPKIVAGWSGGEVPSAFSGESQLEKCTTDCGQSGFTQDPIRYAA
jgi:hypothetical protein